MILIFNTSIYYFIFKFIILVYIIYNSVFRKKVLEINEHERACRESEQPNQSNHNSEKDNKLSLTPINRNINKRDIVCVLSTIDINSLKEVSDSAD